ncbi:MAG TPA: hypothetical protein VMF32_04225 [Xanthobacteraceae bacterium]|nr:hypothetical protein [Xanthobacteraceae bacterium]
MNRKKLESCLVRYVMPKGSEVEIQEATEHWFAFLNTLYLIVLDREQTLLDSQESR